MKYYKRKSPNMYYKTCNNGRMFYWGYVWGGSKKAWIEMASTLEIEKARSSLVPIVPELYSCPLCQNTGRGVKEPHGAHECICTNNPFSIVNKLS